MAKVKMINPAQMPPEIRKQFQKEAQQAAKAQANWRKEVSEKRESDASLQRRRAMGQDARNRDAIERMVKHGMETAEKSGKPANEEAMRREIVKVADRNEHKK